jgi:hypothetical protein
MSFRHSRLLIPVTMACLVISILTVSAEPNPTQGQTQAAATEPNLTEEQMKMFLLTAKVVNSKEISKGLTRPFRLTLSDGHLTHDAGFQSIDQFKRSATLSDGTTEYNFRDTYHFNIAAYELAKLLGLGHMMPVTVERKWEGKTGSLSWWLSVKMNESERIKKNILPPDPEAWNNQAYRKRVFAQLVYDTDINLSNVLIGENWELYMIDFSRAFREYENLARPKDLARCERQLLEKLRQLDQTGIEAKTKPHLSKSEIKALIKRRDKIVAHFEKLIAEKGESAVLY